jgi:hypothetical protein
MLSELYSDDARSEGRDRRAVGELLLGAPASCAQSFRRQL